MVLSSLRSPQAGWYIVQDVCEVNHELDAGVLKEAWVRIADRHTALRTIVEFGPDGEPGLCVQERTGFPCRCLDWRGLSSEVRQQHLDNLLAEDSRQGFDFDDGVPLRFILVTTAPDSHLLIWTSHHVLLDGRSYLTVWREWLAIYDALRTGAEAELPEPVTFQAYSPNLEAEQRFWQSELAGLEQTTGCIVERLRYATDPASTGTAKESRKLDLDETQALENFARDSGVTVHTVVQATWALLLGRYSSRSDLMFGVTQTGRPGRELDDAVGCFIRTIPLRVKVPPDAPLLQWLQEFRAHWLRLRDHGHTAGTALFESLLVYEREPPGETVRQFGGTWERRSLRRYQRTDVPLTLVAYGRPHFVFEIVYQTSLYSGRTISALADQFKTIFRSLRLQPEAPLQALRMLEPSDESWLVHECNRSKTRFAVDLCAHELFEGQVRSAPDRLAIEENDVAIAYGELNEQANRLAWFLREKAGPEDLIVLLMPRGTAAVLSMLAIAKAGAVCLPIDPAFPSARIDAMLATVQPRLVLRSGPLVHDLSSTGISVISLEDATCDSAKFSTDNLPRIALTNNAAYAIFTSGSTGLPKAAVISHRSLVNHTLAASRVYEISEADRRLQFASPGADVFVSEVFTYLCSGACLVACLPTGGFSLHEFAAALEEGRITITGIPARWWKAWVALLAAGQLAVPSALRAVIAGMERLDPTLLAEWKRVTDGEIRLFNAYGPAETSPTATIYESGTSEWESGSCVPIGKPIANTRAYVLDACGNLVPVGVAGELYIGGAGVARGYLNQPELTARSFVADPFSANPDDRLYRTGDLVYRLPDGNLVFLGRLDHQVKIRGFRVELEDVEAALATHRDVHECAAVVDARGDLVAYLTTGERHPSLRELRSHVSRLLPAYMMPAGFVLLEKMLLTPAGKIDRRSLACSEAPRLRPSRDSLEPSTAAEMRLASLWREILHTSRIGTGDNFFELGGDSLACTLLITAIADEFEIELPLSSLLRAPTLAGMAALLENVKTAAVVGREGIIPLQSRGTMPPILGVCCTPQDIHAFRRLVKSLSSDQPVFLVNCPVSPSEPLRTIEDIAAGAQDLIDRARPGRPYILAGFCFAGLVAYEMACRTTSSKSTYMLALFDVFRPGYPRILPTGGRIWPLVRELLRRASAGSFRIACGEVLGHLDYMGTLARRRLVAQANRMFIRNRLRPAARLNESIRVWLEQSAAMYAPAPTDVPVTQFLARDQQVTARVFDDPRLAWHSLCRAGFQVQRVPGTHTTLFLNPNAATLARDLAEVLSRAMVVSQLQPAPERN